MAITAADVKKLRDATGAGMMDAKKALAESDGDHDKAVEFLRISGAVKAAKRSERDAANGIVAAAGHALIRLGSETDFVAKNQEFISLAEAVAEAVDAAGADTVESALDVNLPTGATVAEAVAALSAKIGEKLELSEVARFGGDTHVYLHRRSQDLPPQVGVLVEYTGADPDIVHHVALQIASMNPLYIEQGDIDESVLTSERNLAEAAAREEGKPEQVIPRIVEGKLKDFVKDVCLHDQAPIAHDEPSVGALLAKAGVKITRFARFSAGPDPARR
ncbi:MAG: translation elongation factor Ts [Propionibacteriaceae bacterium]|jgi:elongation factor Ts|nr:translation elongation factor Ts [Propionibacteriaceae bacterium]